MISNIATKDLQMIATFGIFQYVVIFFWNYSQPKEDYTKHEWKHHLSKVFWYCTAGMYEFRLLQGVAWMPEVLGGLGQPLNWVDVDHIAKAPLYKELYKLHMFYHTFSFLTSMLPGNRTKPEMLFHHIITCILIYVSWIHDKMEPGTMVLFLHDVPDIPTGLLKFFYSTGKKIPTLMCFLAMCVTWIYFRIWLMSNMAWAVNQNPNGLHDQSPNNLMYWCGFLLWALVCLHCFWFSLFIRMGSKFLGNPKGKLPDDITEKGKTYKGE